DMVLPKTMVLFAAGGCSAAAGGLPNTIVSLTPRPPGPPRGATPVWLSRAFGEGTAWTASKWCRPQIARFVGGGARSGGGAAFCAGSGFAVKTNLQLVH